MDLWWIIGGTAVSIIVIGWVDHRLNKRFDKVDQDHEQQTKTLLTTRDNNWYQFDRIRSHLMKLLGWNRKDGP